MGVDEKADHKRKRRAKSFSPTFFRAPWRRKSAYAAKGTLHYVIIGAVCAMYLCTVGGTLTFVFYAKETDHPQHGIVMGIPSRYLGPAFLFLGSFIVLFLSILAFTAICIRKRKAQARKHDYPDSQFCWYTWHSRKPYYVTT